LELLLTDHYILHETAQKLKLLTESFGRNEIKVAMKEYQVPVLDKLGQMHYLPCYRMYIITSDNNLPEEGSY